MGNLNISSFICKDADPKKQIIENIVNEIKLPTNENVHLHVITFLSGIEVTDKHIYLDYFVSYLPDSDDKGKYLYLFTIELSQQKDKDGTVSTGKSQYENYIFEISYNEIDISFPYKGTYELEAFKLEEAPIGSARERYKNYLDQKKTPVSVYNFVVK